MYYILDHKTRHQEFNILKQSKLCLDNFGKFSKARYDILAQGKSTVPFERITVCTFLYTNITLLL